MNILMYLILFSAASRNEALFTGTVPINVPTFKVTTSTGETFHAAIRSNGQWVLDQNPDLKPTENPEFVPDIPFYQGQPRKLLIRNVTIEYELPQKRRNRLEETWKQMEYTFLETSAGWMPIKNTDIQLAERARAMAASAKSNTITEDLFSAKNEMGGLEPSEATPRIWLFRGGIIILGILTLTAIYFMVFRKSNTWTPVQ